MTPDAAGQEVAKLLLDECRETMIVTYGVFRGAWTVELDGRCRGGSHPSVSFLNADVRARLRIPSTSFEDGQARTAWSARFRDGPRGMEVKPSANPVAKCEAKSVKCRVVPGGIEQQTERNDETPEATELAAKREHSPRPWETGPAAKSSPKGPKGGRKVKPV